MNCNMHTAFSLCENTSFGSDDIICIMLRNVLRESISFLLDTIMWRDSLTPTTWKSAIVILVLKTGKDPSILLHYRPIARPACMMMLQEMINARLVQFLEKGRNLSPKQYGF